MRGIQKADNNVSSLSRIAGAASLGHHSSLTPITQMIAAAETEEERQKEPAKNEGDRRIVSKWIYVLIVIGGIAVICLSIFALSRINIYSKAETAALKAFQSDPLMQNAEVVRESLVSTTSFFDRKATWDEWCDEKFKEEHVIEEIRSFRCVTFRYNSPDGKQYGQTYYLAKINGEWFICGER